MKACLETTSMCCSREKLIGLKIIGNVSIYPRPVDSGLGEISHLLNSSMVAMQVTEHSLIQLRRYTHSVSLQQYSIFNLVNSSWVPQKWCAILRTSWILSGQPFKVNLYMVQWMGSLSTAPLTMFNLSGAKCMLWIFWSSSIGIYSFLEGNQLRWSAKTISISGLYTMV